VRRGFTGAAVAAALGDGAASACAPAELVASTVAAACVPASAGAPAKFLLSAKVIALTEGVLKSMLLTKLKSTFAAMLVLGIIALGAGGLISKTLATGPVEGTPDMQEQRQANSDDLYDRVVELKRQLQQIQKKIDMLDQDIQPKRKERKTPDIS